MYIKKLIVNYFATIGSLLGFFVSMLKTWVPLLVLFSLAIAFCMLWFAKLTRKHEEAEYRRHRAESQKHNEIERRFKEVEKILARKADKQPLQNVRAGSRPSATYAAMKVQQEKGDAEHDDRGEDQETA